MNTTAAAFFSRIQTDPAQLQKLQSAAPKSRSEFATLLVSLAAQEGITLTPTEVQDHFAAFDSRNEELSEEHLNAVAGAGSNYDPYLTPNMGATNGLPDFTSTFLSLLKNNP